MKFAPEMRCWRAFIGASVPEHIVPIDSFVMKLAKISKKRTNTRERARVTIFGEKHTAGFRAVSSSFEQFRARPPVSSSFERRIEDPDRNQNTIGNTVSNP